MANPLSDLKPVDEDLQNRMLQFEIDCNDGKGNAYACHSVAEFKAMIEGKYDEAATILAKNCDGKNNYGASCYKLGRYLLKGQGVAQSDTLALSKFEKACSLGISPGCQFLGCMLLEGKVSKDPERALKAFHKACSDNDQESCFKLGKQYLAGGELVGNERNPFKALEVLTKACDTGHAPSCRLLAVLYRNGDTGVPSNLAQFEAYKKRTHDLVIQRGASAGLKVT